MESVIVQEPQMRMCGCGHAKVHGRIILQDGSVSMVFSSKHAAIQVGICLINHKKIAVESWRKIDEQIDESKLSNENRSFDLLEALRHDAFIAFDNSLEPRILELDLETAIIN
jgi:hypothetical protein